MCLVGHVPILEVLNFLFLYRASVFPPVADRTQTHYAAHERFSLCFSPKAKTANEKYQSFGHSVCPVSVSLSLAARCKDPLPYSGSDEGVRVSCTN